MKDSSALPPNIVFILTDDQGYWTAGCYGNRELRTPNLDRIAGMGMRFDRFFCASPVCSPARASILTGRIPSQHGVHDWLRGGNCCESEVDPGAQGRLIEYLRGQTGITDLLRQAGYECGISGKWHLGDSHQVQKGFSYWEVHAKGGGPYYDAPMVHQDGTFYRASGYVSDVITDNALGFLDSREHEDRPFYLSVHYTAPHSPWDRGNHPEELYDDYYHNCPFDSTPSDVARAEWIQFRSIPVDDSETRRRRLSGYFAAVTAMDANVGRLLDWLENHNLAENTIVCFTSDNGMNMGHHGVYGKGNATFPLNMYEESVRVPFLMSWPRKISLGSSCQELLSHYDIRPTLLECAGIEDPEAEQLPGVSFVPLLDGTSTEIRDDLVVYDEYGPVRMVRTADWKYVHRYPYGPNELYNLENDPEETENLVDDPAWEARLVELRRRLGDWFAAYVDPARDGVREMVSGSGQIDLAGTAGSGRKSFATPRHVAGKQRG